MASAIFTSCACGSFANITGDGNGDNTYVVWAVVPTGASDTLTLGYSGGLPPGGGATTVAQAYSADVTQLSSQTPVVVGANVSSVTTQTASIAVANNGSGLFFVSAGAGQTNGTQTITASDAGLTTDLSFGAALFAHANSVALSAASHATMTWSPSAFNSIGLAVFR